MNFVAAQTWILYSGYCAAGPPYRFRYKTGDEGKQGQVGLHFSVIYFRLCFWESSSLQISFIIAANFCLTCMIYEKKRLLSTIIRQKFCLYNKISVIQSDFRGRAPDYYIHFTYQ